MAYYGILMKDGTEITHYGVKGMKWGKHIFGKVKGVFGKGNKDTSEKDTSEPEAIDPIKERNWGSGMSKNIYEGKNSRSTAANDRLYTQYMNTMVANSAQRGIRKGKDITYLTKEKKKANNTRKRYSASLNR